MLFSDIPGHETLKDNLRKEAARGAVAHARLFVGRPGAGQLAMAMAYAQYLNCENPSAEDSCGQCSSCLKYQGLKHPDLHNIFPVAGAAESSDKHIQTWRAFVAEEPYGGLNQWAEKLSAEGKNLIISKAETRKIVEQVSLKAFEAKYKVLLLWRPELLNPSSANALLKVIEEPPSQTLFFFVAEDPERILATILSRLQVVQVGAFQDQEVATYLQQKGLATSEAEAISHLAEGNMQEAMNLAQPSAASGIDVALWLRNCYSGKFPELLATADKFQKLGKQGQRAFLQSVMQQLREALLSLVEADSLHRLRGESLDFTKGFAPYLDLSRMDSLLAMLSQAEMQIGRNANARIMFFDLSRQMSQMAFKR